MSGMNSDTSAPSVAQIGTEMGDLLMRPSLDPAEDFFLSGGDSLRAVELISRLVERYGIDDETTSRLQAALLLAIFDEATPAALADVLDAVQRS